MHLDPATRRQFEALLLPHLDAAYNLARWLTHDDHAAQDAVQEAYLRAAKYFASFRGGDPRPWLLAVSRRAALDGLAKARAANAVPFDETAHDRGDEATNPEAVAARKGDQERVRRALVELPPALREAVVLRELEGLSYQQIVAVTESPVGTLMSRLARGRQQLQQRLGVSSEGVR